MPRRSGLRTRSRDFLSHRQNPCAECGCFRNELCSWKNKKKYGISDERAALYARLDEWAQHLKSRREAGSTSVVNLGDLAVYGVLNCARGQRTWDDILKHDQGIIDGWLSDMDESIPEEILVR